MRSRDYEKYIKVQRTMKGYHQIRRKSAHDRYLEMGFNALTRDQYNHVIRLIFICIFKRVINFSSKIALPYNLGHFFLWRKDENDASRYNYNVMYRSGKGLLNFYITKGSIKTWVIERKFTNSKEVDPIV